jgi:hypothetical protein
VSWLRSASVATRGICGALFALLLALRLLSPAGFMPAFGGHGSVTIVICPDYDPPAAPVAHHHHGGSKKLQQHCPYAAGAGAATAVELPELAALMLLAATLLLGRTYRFLERHRAHERPPLRGPPLPV